MKRLYSILTGTQGVFVRFLEKEDNSFFIHPDRVDYLAASNDKQNLRSDLFNVYTDLRKATDEAEVKLGVV